MSWERLDDRRACRISAFHKGSIRDNQETLDAIRRWMIERIPKFRRTFDPKLAEFWRLVRQRHCRANLAKQKDRAHYAGDLWVPADTTPR